MKFLTLLILILPTLVFSQNKVTPIVKNQGGIYAIEEAVEYPDSTLQYKIVIDLKSGAKKEGDLAFALHNSARMMNLHGIGGVKNMEVIGVIHSDATKSILSNSAYKKRYGVENPNTELIAALTEAGMKIYVCGQSLIARGFAVEELNPNVQISISALTILTTYQLKGYALLTF